MSFSFAFNVFLAGMAPVVSALIPKLIYRGGFSLKTSHILLGISAGLLFAIATVDLIPEAMSIAGTAAAHSTTPPTTEHAEHGEHGKEEEDEHDHTSQGRLAMVGVAVGYLALLLIDIFMRASGHAHSHGGQVIQVNDIDVGHEMKETEMHGTKLSGSFSIVALVGLAVHSFVDGIVMAGAFEASEAMGNRVAWALIIHKIPDGFVMSALMAANRNNRDFYSGLTFLAAMTPTGATIGFVMMDGMSPLLLGFVLGFGAGTFLFITATGIIPELVGKEKDAASPAVRKYSMIAMVASYVGFLLFDGLFHAH